MKHSRSSRIALCAGLSLAVVVGCATGPKVETVVEEGPEGVVVVQTIRTQATVVAIDARARTVRLQPRRGDPKTFRVGEGAVNFGQVQVGDEVQAEVIHETAISLVPGGAAPSVGGGVAVALAPEGSKPGGIMANTIEATATIVAIDAHEHTITLEFLDGSVQEVDVAKHRDLSQLSLGDSVRIQLTEAVAIQVVKP